MNGATSNSGAQTVAGNVDLLPPSFRLQIAKRSAKLSDAVRAEFAQVARLLTGVDAKSATCTAYTDKGKGDKALTKAQAKAACHTLKNDGFAGSVQSVGMGSSNPIAQNNNPQGRAKNRRLIITFTV